MWRAGEQFLDIRSYYDCLDLVKYGYLAHGELVCNQRESGVDSLVLYCCTLNQPAEWVAATAVMVTSRGSGASPTRTTLVKIQGI